MQPFLEGIKNADEYLLMGAYKIHDRLLPNKEMAGALKMIAAKRLMKDNIVICLENYLTKEEVKLGFKDIKSGESLHAYQNMGIKLIRGSQHHKSTHIKILVSSKYALIGTTNFDKNFLELDNTIVRDFSLVIIDSSLIQQLKNVFDVGKLRENMNLPDFDIVDIKPGETRLTWGPDQHRNHLRQLIQNARQTIEVYQQALQDKEITELLCNAIKKGIKISILMSEFPFGIKNGNTSKQDQAIIRSVISQNPQYQSELRLTGRLIENGLLKGNKLHIHAKVMIIDGAVPEKAIMYLGSANFYTPALDEDRNVGVITRNAKYINPVREQFQKDWNAHKP